MFCLRDFKQFHHLLNPISKNLLLELNNRLGIKRKFLLNERKKFKGFKYRECTEFIRNDKSWKAQGPNPDIMRRHVEITGPTNDTKMMINAINSNADCYMTDLEDSMSPMWSNVIQAHDNIYNVLRGNLYYEKKNNNGEVMKIYEQNIMDKSPVFFTRLRGLHLEERGFMDVNKNFLSATFTDFALYMANNSELINNGENITSGGIYFYVPKIQTYEEALLINEMFQIGEEFMGLKRGTIKATLLIETFPAIFQTEEIIFALRDYICGLNCGRWDYLFSLIKSNMNMTIPDRSLLTMEQPFMQAYVEQIVKTCHKRGIHAMGGMSAFIPSGEDNREIVGKIIKDKELEISLGCDGAWVAHPGLIDTVKDLFNNRLEGADNQYNIVPQREIKEEEYTNMGSLIKPDNITEVEFDNNLRIAMQYLAGWLYGNGAVALNGIMEDMATCEISLYQVKQQLFSSTVLNTERIVNISYIHNKLDMIISELKRESQVPYAKDYFEEAREIIVIYLCRKGAQFLPDIAYKYLR